MNDILANLADNYPQAPPSGGTPRMRDVVFELNRVEDEENDLIFANGIEIGKYIHLQHYAHSNFKPLLAP